MKTGLTLGALLLSASPVLAADVQEIIKTLNSQPYETATLNQDENQKLFDQYCVGNPNSPDIPEPRYGNPLVNAAAAKLSETKTRADEMLKQMAKNQMKGHIAAAAKTCQKLTEAPLTSVSDLAKELAKEVSLATVDGFTPRTHEIFRQLAKVYGQEIAKSGQVLAANLPNEVKGVDFAVLTEIATKLSSNLQKELQTVDFSVFRKLSTDLANILKGEVQPQDTKVILPAVQALVAEWSASTEVSVKNVVKALVRVQDYIQKTPPEKFDPVDLSSEVSDAIYYLNSAVKKGKIVLNATTTGPVEVLRKQFLNGEMVNIMASVDELQKLLASKKPESNTKDYNEVRWAANSVVDYLAEQSAALSPAAQESLNRFKTENSKFSSAEALVTAKALLEALAAGKKPEAVQQAMTLVDNLAQVQSLLGPDSLKLQAVLGVEVSKNEAEDILTYAAELQKQIQSAGGNLTEGLIDAVSNLVYSLENLKVELAADTQKAKVELLALNQNLYEVQSLGENLKASPEMKKSEHFYFYGGVTKLYKLSSTSVPANAPAGTTPEANIFLTQVCGEYRDRATMIEAKMKWAKNIQILPTTNSKAFSIDINKNVWAQIPASAYDPYLAMSGEVWEAKRKSQPRYIEIADLKNVDNPVDGFTVCETKYIFSEYVGKEREFDNWESYSKGFDVYKTACPVADLTDYYDFRGDSNYKHYSPESNGMIWYVTSLARACKSPYQAKSGQTQYTDDDCRNYFTRPFFYRYNAARAGLATWLFRDDKHANVFGSSGSMVAIYPHRYPELAPFSFSFNHEATTGDLFEFDNKWLSLPGVWNRSDIGYNAFTGLGTAAANLKDAYVRIRDAVDRHTDWYASGFNDKAGVAKNQAYSPFVASSYEMSESDNFTTCGITVNCPPDGLKRWMFVFRIKKANWYTPSRIAKNEPVDFDKMWFDETAFGDSGLANSEKAWDRLGTSMESEMETILYLVNVNPGDGGDE